MDDFRSPLQTTVDALLDRKGRVWLTGSPEENKRKLIEILYSVHPNFETGKDMRIDIVME